MRSIWQHIFEALAVTGGPPVEVLLDSTHVKAHRCSAGGKGAQTQAIGRSRGGRTTKLHALSDGLGKPLRFLLTDGQAADCRAAATLLVGLSPRTLVMADRAYDTNAIRRQIEEQGAVPNIPPKARQAPEELLQPGALPNTQRRRAHVLQAQGLPAHRHALRQARRQLPRSYRDRRQHHMLVMSPEPKRSYRVTNTAQSSYGKIVYPMPGSSRYCNNGRYLEDRLEARYRLPVRSATRYAANMH